MLLKKLEFLLKCLKPAPTSANSHKSPRNSFQFPPTPKTPRFPSRKPCTNTEKLATRKEMQANFLRNGRTSVFFSRISGETSAKRFEKLFPEANSFESSPPPRDFPAKHSQIQAFLPRPSPYIQHFLHKPEEKADFRGESANFLENSSENASFEALLGHELGDLIGFFNFEAESRTFSKIVDLLVSKGLCRKAIELFEGTLQENGRLDAIIRSFLDTDEYSSLNPEEKFAYLKKMRDFSNVHEKFRELVDNSELRLSEEIIEFWQNSWTKRENPAQNAENLKEMDLSHEFREKARQLRTLQALRLENCAFRWRSLREFNELSAKQAELIISELISTQQFDSALRVLPYLRLPFRAFSEEISKKSLIFKLTREPSLDNFQAFQRISSNTALALAIVKEIPEITTKLSLIKLVISRVDGGKTARKLEKQAISLEILCEIGDVGAERREFLRKFEGKPKALLFFLIKAKKTRVLSRLKGKITRFFSDTELLDFAKQSVFAYFRAIIQENSQPLPKVEEIGKTQGKREKSRESPDFFFFKDLVNVCQDQALVAETCLAIADEFSTLFHEISLKHYRFLLLEYTRKFLLLARKIFKRLDFREQNVARCEKYLQFLEILEIFLKIPLKFAISLKQFFYPEAVQALLEYLLKHDFIEKAITVCEKSGVNPSKVLIIWVLWLLRFEEFGKARETLAKSLEFFESSFNEQEIHQILSALEASSYENSQAFFSLQQSLCFSRVLLLRQGETRVCLRLIERESREKSRELFQTRIFEECVFFLKNYGSSQLFINFHVQKGLLEEACRYVFNENLPTRVFVEEILETCVFKAQVSRLQAVIQKIDPSFQRSWNYLTACCQYLSEKKLSDELYSLQLFMREFDKSAIRCLRLFCAAEGKDRKIAYLSSAETHFTEELAQLRESFGFQGQIANKQQRIQQMLTLIHLQKELLGYPQFSHVHLFVNKETQGLVAETLLLLEESELPVKVLKVFQLEFREVLANLLSSLAQSRKLKEIEKLLQNLVFWKKNASFSKILRRQQEEDEENCVFIAFS